MLLLHVPVQPDQIGCHSWHRLSEVLLHCPWTTWGSKEQVQWAKPSFFFSLLLSADTELRNDRRGWVKTSCQKNKRCRTSEGEGEKVTRFHSLSFLMSGTPGLCSDSQGSKRPKVSLTPHWGGSDCLTLALWAKVTCILNILKRSFSTGFTSGDFTSRIVYIGIVYCPNLIFNGFMLSVASNSPPPNSLWSPQNMFILTAWWTYI